MRDIILIAHNLRSTHNVGSLLRTADGMGVKTVYFTGYTPYPAHTQDVRLPHLSAKIDKQIHKTALGAEQLVAWVHADDVLPVLASLRRDGYLLAGVEQAQDAVRLPEFSPPQKLALVVGREVEGIEPAVLKALDTILEIPMFGHKESFNVVQAAAIALYHCRFC